MFPYVVERLETSTVIRRYVKIPSLRYNNMYFVHYNDDPKVPCFSRDFIHFSHQLLYCTGSTVYIYIYYKTTQKHYDMIYYANSSLYIMCI